MMKKILLVILSLLAMVEIARAQAGCSVLGGWPGAQYGLQAQLITDSIPCYGITGTKNTPIVLQTSPNILSTLTVTGANSHALSVGRLGSVTPALSVDSSNASSITGVVVTAQSSGNGVNLTAVGETNVPFIFNGAGNGTINFGTASTGVVNSFRNFFVNHDSTPTLTLGSLGGTLAHIATPGTSGLSFDSNNNSQVKILDTASANRQITLTGSNGGNPTIGTSAGNLAITPAVVGAAGINGSMAANSMKCNNTGSPATSIDCTQAQASALLVNPVITLGVAVDFNTVGDYAITIPSWITRWGVNAFRILNSGTTASLTTAQYGIFTGAGGTGTAIIASGSSLAAITSNAANTAANFLQPGLTVSAYWSVSTVYFRVTQAQGAAASGTVYLILIPFL